jgi:hypothetical protein
VLLALLWIIFVGVSAAAAEAKGRGIAEGVLLGLCLGPLGMAVEALLPARPAEPAKAGAAARALPLWLFGLLLAGLAALIAAGLGLFWLR